MPPKRVTSRCLWRDDGVNTINVFPNAFCSGIRLVKTDFMPLLELEPRQHTCMIIIFLVIVCFLIRIAPTRKVNMSFARLIRRK